MGIIIQRRMEKYDPDILRNRPNRIYLIIKITQLEPPPQTGTIVYCRKRISRSMIHISTIIILGAIVLINIFFGYWRANTRRLSRQWLMAIHIPVPIAIILRLVFLGWNWLLLPVFVVAFAVGQVCGGRIRAVLDKKHLRLTSVLPADLFRALSFKAKHSVADQE